MGNFFSIVAYFHVKSIAFHYKKSRIKLIFFFLLANWQLKVLLLFSVCWVSLQCSSIAAGLYSHSGAHMAEGASVWLHPPHSHLFLQIPYTEGARLAGGGQKVQL